jgi:hypothetical protein
MNSLPSNPVNNPYDNTGSSLPQQLHQQLPGLGNSLQNMTPQEILDLLARSGTLITSGGKVNNAGINSAGAWTPIATEENAPLKPIEDSLRFENTFTKVHGFLPKATIVQKEELLHSLFPEDIPYLVYAADTGKYYQYRNTQIGETITSLDLASGRWHWVTFSDKNQKINSMGVLLTPEEQKRVNSLAKNPAAREKAEAFEIELKQHQKDSSDIEEKINGFQGSLGDPFSQIE